MFKNFIRKIIQEELKKLFNDSEDLSFKPLKIIQKEVKNELERISNDSEDLSFKPLKIISTSTKCLSSWNIIHHLVLCLSILQILGQTKV